MRSKSPSSPEEARDRLADLIRQMQTHLAEYQPHETFVSADLMGWFIAGANEFLNGKRSLEQGLGLARVRGRPKDKPGKGQYFTLALDVCRMRQSNMSWDKIAAETGFDDPKELRDIYRRNEQAVLKHVAERVSLGVAERRKGAKSRHLTTSS
jgi:hypothetical protein